MNIHTGEILALTSYPSYSSQKLADGDSEYIKQINQDNRKPFLNRITQGLYTPGSIVKPFVAIGALNEGVIDQYTNIVSTGKLEVPNPYDPSKPTFFSDWKAHGSVDVRRALAVSSNIYFYVVGGGYKDIQGLGITKLESYFRKFGFGASVNGDISSVLTGTIPNPTWKAENFDGDIWRLGDTYFTSIGQYGFQATPLQVVRAVAAVANKGTVYNPIIIKDAPPQVAQKIEGIKPEVWKIVHEGMRQGVVEGTAKGLYMDAVHVAAKTGTAELGVSKDNVNSWTTGFFPYENPRYAFVIVMEKGDRHNVIGGVAVSRKLFDWMAIYTPEYFK
jgi:penicillin-binding protein 2